MNRIVIKIGSAVLTQDNKIAEKRMYALVEFLATLNKQYEVILVSSGAVAAGNTELKLNNNNILSRQTLAAIGQPLLMKRYKRYFDDFDTVVAQLLMTANNFDSIKQTKNAKKLIENLLHYNVIPIINENDSISIDELVFGDNDQLSAYVACSFDADMLIILSDIDSYYDKNPSKFHDAQKIKVVDDISSLDLEAPMETNNTFATGGIVTKLKAADYMIKNNKKMFLASGFDLGDIKSYLLQQIHKGGTIFQ